MPGIRAVLRLTGVSIALYDSFPGTMAILLPVIPCFRPSSTTRLINSYGVPTRSSPPGSSTEIQRPSTPRSIISWKVLIAAWYSFARTAQFTVP